YLSAVSLGSYRPPHLHTVEFCTQLKQQGLLARNMQSLCSSGGSPRHNLRIQGLIF
ncbi:hypothetical protein NDU88_011518, partial [Pleurodeles waltl]